MSNPYESPQQQPPPYHGAPQDTTGDSTHGVIPYKNPHALIAYYSGIFLLLCCVTPVPLGVIPFVLGIIGLRKRSQNPVIKGSVHAWIGIVLGALSAVGSVVVAIALIAAAVSK